VNVLCALSNRGGFLSFSYNSLGKYGFRVGFTVTVGAKCPSHYTLRKWITVCNRRKNGDGLTVLYTHHTLHTGMTKYRKGPQRTVKEHKGPQKTHKGPQRSITQDHRGRDNHEKTARLATILFNFLQLVCLYFCNFVFFCEFWSFNELWRFTKQPFWDPCTN